MKAMPYPSHCFLPSVVMARLSSALKLLFRSNFVFLSHKQIRSPFLLSARGKKTVIVSDDSLGSKHCYADIFIQDCYRMRQLAKNLNPKTIVDIGANIGFFSALCRLYFPEAAISAYEPNPKTFEWLKKNTKALNIAIHNKAIAKDSGVAMFAPEHDSTVSHLDAEGALQVECLGASDLVKNHAIDLLKMDCEGGEWAVLENPEFMQKVSHSIIEYHLDGKRNFETFSDAITQGGHVIERISRITENVGIVWTTHKYKAEGKLLNGK